MIKLYEIQYQLVDSDKVYTTAIATEHVEMAQMVWDSIMYLRTFYKTPLTPRPR